ncbi:DUF998 domain-containing protein [Pseudoalteromonas sp. SMS1]|uniref:DUF998 domain-containing protein n=1 Tax=Pseudoalteromonas sp. SMS1 TaxID=2908894 RepID=UPI001F2040D9|nr:DUF998 domain-containing protein [Pseudoalteromonas sp. SMS1]MCF2857733.1 DUF998 domain-containing protein [Pseudoalteromonas sp. SMS1]
MFEKIILLSGLIATIWITIGVIIAAKFYPNYNHNEQFCSELGAVGSPTQKLSPLINNYPLGILFCLFGWAVIQYAQSSAILVTVGWLVILHGAGTWVAGIFPMDKDPYTQSPSLHCKIHSWAGFIMLLSLLIAPILLAFSPLPVAFRAFSMLSAMVAIHYLVKMAQAVKHQKNVGRYQRISYWAKLIWLAGFSVLLWAS